MTKQPAPYRSDDKLLFGVILEARTHFLGEELRLLPGCDVPAPFELEWASLCR